MTFLRSKAIIILLILPTIFSISTSNANIQLNQVTTIKVGLLSPQSGPISAIAQGIQQAAILAITNLNNKGSINGSYSFQLTIYDTSFERKNTLIAMTAAVTGGMHYIIGPANSENTIAAAEIAVTNTVPLISYAPIAIGSSIYDDHAVANDEGYLWRTQKSGLLQGEAMANLAYDNGYRNMVIVHLNDTHGVGLANSTRDEFITLGGVVSNIIPYLELTIDPNSIVTQIKTENPDIIVAISDENDGSKLFVEMANQNLNIPVVGSYGISNETIFSEGIGVQEAMQGFVTVKPITRETPGSIAFKSAYKEAFTDMIGDYYIAEVYDAVWAGALAINTTVSTIGKDIISGLSSISWDGASGPISFDDKGNSIAGYFEFSEVQGNQMISVGNWDAINGISYSDSEFYNRWNIIETSSSTTTSTTSISSTTSTTGTTSDESTSSSSNKSSSEGSGSVPFPFYWLMTSIIISSIVLKFKRRR